MLQLEENGSFASKCTKEEQQENEVCPAQTSALIKVQLIAQVTQISSPLLGQIADRFGAPILAYSMAGCAWIGLTLLVVAVEYGRDMLLYVAFAFLAMSTWMGGLLTLQTGMYFTGQTRSRVIFALNALFDAGGITYLGLWGIGGGTGASLTAISLGYLIVALFLYGGAVYLWTVTKPQDRKATETVWMDPSSVAPSAVDGTIQQPQSEHGMRLEASSRADDTEEPELSVSAHGKRRLVWNENSMAPELEIAPQAPPDLAPDREFSQVAELSGGDESTNDVYVVVSERTSYKQLTSRPFLLLAVFWTIHVVSNQWILTTARDFLASLGDDEVGNKYLTIFTLLMPVSLVGIPFVDFVIVHYGFIGGFHTINALALAYNLVRLTSDDLNVQIASFIFFSFFRSFLFGVSFSFLPTLLAPKVVGKATGIMYASIGVFNFLNIPLTNYTVEQQGGDFFIASLIYTLLVLPCIALACALARAIEQEKVSKEESTHARLRQSMGGVLLDRRSQGT